MVELGWTSALRIARYASWVAVCGLLVSGFGQVRVASAAPSPSEVSELAKRLRTSDDFRVRTQAALALGATADGRAVPALCDGLKDPNAAVRSASAAALGRTGPQGVACLQNQSAIEQIKNVQVAIEGALRLLAPAKPAINENTKFYIAISEVTNGTTRATPDLQNVVRKSLEKYFSKLNGVVVAPATETPEQAKALLAKHPKVKPLCVWPKVTVVYERGDLKLKVDLSLLTYPGKAFRGSVSRSLTMPEVGSPDVQAEDELIDMASGALVPDVERQAPRI
jgi:HEAT repeats